MLDLWKESSYDIFKMFVNQIGMTMFGLVLSFATQQNDTLFWIATVFSVLFYLFLLYSMTWDIGNAEKIRIDGGRLRYRPLKGFWLSLFANALNILLAILIIIGFFSASVYENGAPASPTWAVNLYGTPRVIATFLQAMYAAFFSINYSGAPWLSPFMFLLVVLPALVTCTAAYIAGVKGFRVFPQTKPRRKKQ